MDFGFGFSLIVLHWKWAHSARDLNAFYVEIVSLTKSFQLVSASSTAEIIVHANWSFATENASKWARVPFHWNKFIINHCGLCHFNSMGSLTEKTNGFGAVISWIEMPPTTKTMFFLFISRYENAIYWKVLSVSVWVNESGSIWWWCVRTSISSFWIGACIYWPSWGD